MSRKMVSIGIDLGTTKCCVGVVRNGKVEILENERANKTTPSYVAFTGTERLVGEDAKDQATLNPANTVFGVKGIIGRGLEDPQVKLASTNMPYIIANNAGDTCINVTYKGDEEVLFPQQVTAMLLTKMKKLAQTRLGCSVEAAVISVPASFSNAQRQATKDAATIAGLKVLALINEPTAAAIAYQANRKEEDEETIAVVDFGGGKLDVAIVLVTSASVKVKSLSGTMDLGGNSVDEILMKYVLEQFRARFSLDPPNGPSVMKRLRVACVKLKHSLSLLPKVQDQLDCFGEEFLLPISMSRGEYDAMISSMISPCMSTHFARACAKNRNISRVVLVGGSTRIPLAPEEIQHFFKGTKLDRSVNPDEAVTHGAAIYAALLSGDNTVEELAVHDILPNTFCIGTKNNECVQDVFQAPQIPSLQTHRVLNNELELKQAFYEVLAGRKDSHKFIGTFCLSQEFARAVSLVDEVCFEINNCGVFDVHVHLKPNHLFRDVLHNNTARLSESKLRDAVERENMFRKDDKDEEDRIAALTDLETKCFDLQSAMLTRKGKICFPELVEEIVKQASETIDWLDTTTMVTRIECRNKMKNLEKLERNLQENIKEMVKLEKERAAAEKYLRMFCTKLEEEVKDANNREEVELVAEIGELVQQNKEWLQTNEIPSTTDCVTRTAVLKRVHLKLTTNVQERLQEKARLAAIQELQCRYAILQEELTMMKSCEQDQPRVNKLTDKILAVLKWPFTDSGPSKADCDAKKIELDEVLLEIQNLKEEAEEHERMRVTVVTSLQTHCDDIRAQVGSCLVIKSDSPPAAQLMTEVNATLAWLQEGKTASLSQCEEKGNIIQSLLTAFHEAVKDQEDQIIFQKREDERRTALTNFQAQLFQVRFLLLTEAVQKQHSDLAIAMVRLEQEIIEWLETTTTFTNLEFEGRLDQLEGKRVTLVALLEEEKKQLLVDAQQETSSEIQASPTDTEGAVLNAGGDKDEKCGDPKRSMEDEKDQNNRMNSDDAQEKKNGDGGSVENNAGSMEQKGAMGDGADGENNIDNNNGANAKSNETQCNVEQN